MGARTCSRGNCDNIMCDRYSITYGYLCDDCFNELVFYGISADIELFMDSDKPETIDTEVVSRFFHGIFEVN